MPTPAPLTSPQKRILLVLTLVIALTRLAAIAFAPFDWDEALFSLGVANYDVTAHHPHPPGYPLFVGAAKLVHLTGVDGFRALQVVVVLGAMLVFPMLFLLSRELGFTFVTSIGAAALYAFLPNVWVYGGTAFSDVPAVALLFAACWLLLRGRRDDRAYVLGAIVLAVSLGFRPANLLVAAAPALIATWHRVRAKSWATIGLAGALGALITGGSYLAAALASGGIEPYLAAVHVQSEWVRRIDSWRNPVRPPLFEAAKTFLLWPFEHQDPLNVMEVAAAISGVAALLRRRCAPLLTIAMFLPLAIVSWLNLDINTASRYAIGYMPMYALLAVDGFGVIAFRRRQVQSFLAFALTIVFAVWTWPALRVQRTTDPPPTAALKWVNRNAAPDAKVYVHASLEPLATLLLTRFRPTYFHEAEEIPRDGNDGWIVDWQLREGAHNFVRPRNALWKVIRRRNFEASVAHTSGLLRYADGWFDHEQEGTLSWRWMGKESRTELPAYKGSGRLSIRAFVPLDQLPSPPTIEVQYNGQTLERIIPDAEYFERSWIVASTPGKGMNQLQITTTETMSPAEKTGSSDTRQLGLRVERLAWTPAG